jgi:hypothetical protein
MNEIIAKEPQNPTPVAPYSTQQPDAVHAAQQQAATSPKAYKYRKPQAYEAQPAFQQIEGPPLPISADKQRRLGDLLRRYQADQVTPAQYHAERAKILAEP